MFVVGQVNTPNVQVGHGMAPDMVEIMRAHQASDGLRALCSHVGTTVRDINRLGIGDVVVVAPEVFNQNRDGRISHTYILVVTQLVPEKLFDVFELDNIDKLYAPSVHLIDLEQNEPTSVAHARESIEESKRSTLPYPFEYTVGVGLEDTSRMGHPLPRVYFNISKDVTFSFLNQQKTTNTDNNTTTDIGIEARISQGYVFVLPNITSSHITQAFSKVQGQFELRYVDNKPHICTKPTAYNCSNAVFDTVANAVKLSGVKCDINILNGLPPLQSKL